MQLFNQHNSIFTNPTHDRCATDEYADVTIRLLADPGDLNSKSHWLKQQSEQHLFYGAGPAELILKASRQISLVQATNHG